MKKTLDAQAAEVAKMVETWMNEAVEDLKERGENLGCPEEYWRDAAVLAMAGKLAELAPAGLVEPDLYPEDLCFLFRFIAEAMMNRPEFDPNSNGKERELLEEIANLR